MQNLLDKNVRAILLVPVQGEDLTLPLAQAARLKVPVLVLGEAAFTGEAACVIGGDDAQAGAMAAGALTSRLTEPGRVLLITGEVGDAAAALRLRGALPVLRAQAGLTILYQAALGGRSADGLLALLQAYPTLNGVLCLTGESTELAAKTVSRLSRKVWLVGMDCGQNRITYLENHQVDALVLGMPFTMGYLGAQFAAQHLQGATIPTQYYTQSRVIDQANMYLPENQKLVFPMLQ